MRERMRDFLKEPFNPMEFKAGDDASGTFEVIQAIIDARKYSGLTQKELAAKTGIAQSDISKFENGNGNPSILTLHRLATGMGMKLKLEFCPAVNA